SYVQPGQPQELPLLYFTFNSTTPHLTPMGDGLSSPRPPPSPRPVPYNHPARLLFLVYEYLRTIYDGVGHVYAPFMPNQLYFQHKLVARFTHPETVTNLTHPACEQRLAPLY